jgi:hypothetical protein
MDSPISNSPGTSDDGIMFVIVFDKLPFVA